MIRRLVRQRSGRKNLQKAKKAAKENSSSKGHVSLERKDLKEERDPTNGTVGVKIEQSEIRNEAGAIDEIPSKKGATESSTSGERNAAAENPDIEDDDDKSDSGGSTSSDPDAALKCIHRNRQVTAGGGEGSTDPTELRGSLNRYNELLSYSNRSERSHLVPDATPSDDEMARRKVKVLEDVKFHADDGHSWTDEDFQHYFMQEEDFNRCDADIELTTFRWEKHKRSKMPFDEKVNTIRGLEEILHYDPKREAARTKHVQDVLTESLKQKVNGNTELDWEKVRAVALRTSHDAERRARQLGAQDEKDARDGVSASRRLPSFQKTKRTGERPGRKSVNKMRLMLSMKAKK